MLVTKGPVSPEKQNSFKLSIYGSQQQTKKSFWKLLLLIMLNYCLSCWTQQTNTYFVLTAIICTLEFLHKTPP